MMDLEKRYFDLEGNRRSILEMVRIEPVWAANRIQEGEKAAKQLAVVMRILKERKRIAVTHLADYARNRGLE